VIDLGLEGNVAIISEAFYREALKRIPIWRVREAHEFGDLVAFLVSERAGFIAGASIDFDGGSPRAV
jgi:NAD(P)-dependent dehydrogenase (short-subunit alcohol dehydrogenase family)